MCLGDPFYYLFCLPSRSPKINNLLYNPNFSQNMSYVLSYLFRIALNNLDSFRSKRSRTYVACIYTYIFCQKFRAKNSKHNVFQQGPNIFLLSICMNKECTHGNYRWFIFIILQAQSAYL